MDVMEEARAILAQLVDVDGDPDRAGVPDALVGVVAEALQESWVAALGEEWAEVEPDELWDDEARAEMLPAWSEIAEGLWQAHVAAHRAAADEVRRACQMQGRARVGEILVEPNGEFVTASGPEEVRARQLRDWPASPHWYVTLTDPDGESDTYRSGDLASWAALLTEARERQAAWEARARADRARRERRVQVAKGVRRDAEQALAQAQAELDEAWAEWDEIRPAVDQSAPAMSAAEFRCYRDWLGVTMEWLAARLGVAERTVRRWEAEATAVPAGVAAEVRQLVAVADEQLAAMLDAAPADDPVVVTYRGDEDHWAADGSRWPASWHRALCARLADRVPGLRIVYREAAR